MPEGPEIRRAADALAAALAGRRVRRLVFAFAHLKPFESRLRGKKVVAVQARGKAILTRFSSGHAIYSHNQLYGRWHISENGEAPKSSRSLRLALYTSKGAAFLYSASEIEVLKEGALGHHPYLSRLGPELLDPDLGLEDVLARLQEPRYRRRSLMALLQDQSVLAGMGNYLCCEALHRSGIQPQQRIQDLQPRQLRRLADSCLRLTRQSYRTGGITNTLSRARQLQRRGASFEDYRFLVYRRAGKPCHRCGATILKARIGGRPAYLCPRCQAGNKRG